MHEGTRFELRNGEPWCVNHERPLIQCVEERLGEARRQEAHAREQWVQERFRAQVRESALRLMCERGDSVEDAVLEATALERRLAEVTG